MSANILIGSVVAQRHSAVTECGKYFLSSCLPLDKDTQFVETFDYFGHLSGNINYPCRSFCSSQLAQCGVQRIALEVHCNMAKDVPAQL